MPNLNQLNTIGSGAYFPIKITQSVDEDGNPETTLVPDGNGGYKEVPKTGWYMLRGDVELIKQNITTILTYQIGQRFRQENFGCRTWECLEEPHTSALVAAIKEFIKRGISTWEPRITALKIEVSRHTKESINIRIYFKVQDSVSVEDLDFSYNLI